MAAQHPCYLTKVPDVSMHGVVHPLPCVLWRCDVKHKENLTLPLCFWDGNFSNNMCSVVYGTTFGNYWHYCHIWSVLCDSTMVTTDLHCSVSASLRACFGTRLKSLMNRTFLFVENLVIFVLLIHKWISEFLEVLYANCESSTWTIFICVETLWST
jgi:hypothetical protein